jgi:hypothetical protein
VTDWNAFLRDLDVTGLFQLREGREDAEIAHRVVPDAGSI